MDDELRMVEFDGRVIFCRSGELFIAIIERILARMDAVTVVMKRIAELESKSGCIFRRHALKKPRHIMRVGNILNHYYRI